MQFQACAYCDHPNPVGTNYCNDCGAALHLKPCRACGAVAVAKAKQCPACKAEFPARPTINVDIPWAVPNAPQVSGRPASALPAPRAPARADLNLGAGEEELSLATTRAFAATQRLIEKASTRPMPQETGSELVLPMRRPVVLDATRSVPFAGTAGGASAAPVDRRIDAGRPARRYGPAVVITLLGLTAAVALIYLVRYAELDSTGAAREIASPHKLLRPAATAPAPQDAAPAIVAVPEVLPAAGAAPPALPTLIPAAATADTDPYSAAIVPLPDPIRTAVPIMPAAVAPAAPMAAPANSAIAPAGMPAAMSIPTGATGDCRPELQALNLCGKVQQ